MLSCCYSFLRNEYNNFMNIIWKDSPEHIALWFSLFLKNMTNKLHIYLHSSFIVRRNSCHGRNNLLCKSAGWNGSLPGYEVSRCLTWMAGTNVKKPMKTTKSSAQRFLVIDQPSLLRPSTKWTNGQLGKANQQLC